MQMKRRELVYLVFIPLCSFAAIRASAQVEPANSDPGSAFVHLQREGVRPVESFSDAATHLITLELERTPLKDALRAVAKQGEVQLSYNDRDIPVGLLVTVRMSDATVEQALTLVLRGTELRARAVGDGIVIERQVSHGRSERRTLQGSLAGRVTDAATGRPIAAAAVRLEEASLATTTSSEGTFRFPVVPADTYTLTVRQIGYERMKRTIVVADGEEGRADFAMTPAPTMLNQVVTTGTVIPTEVKALPTPISVITADEIERQHASTLTSILRQAVPTSVAFNNPANPAATQISVRGASSLVGAGDMKIFVDGIDATNYSFTPVDPASIERIEVVRGPQAATIYGADAAGGVIEIFTKRADSTTRPRANAKAAFGVLQTPYQGFRSVPRQEYSGSVRGGGEGASYNFGGGYSHLADYLPNGEISRQSTASAYGGMHVTRGILSADLSARYHDNDYPQVSNPDFLSTGYIPQSPPRYLSTSSIDETVGARLTAQPTSWWHNQFTVGMARHTTHIAQVQPRYTTAGDSLLTVSNSASRKISVGYNTSVVGTLGQHISGSLALGVDHYSENADLFSTSRALNAEGSILTSPSGSLSGSLTNQTNTGYFAQAQLGLHDAIFLTTGVRAEDNSDFGVEYGMAILPRVGLTLARDIGAATMKVRASYGRALRTPTAGQALGLVTATSILLPNPLLAAEKQQGWDGGIDLVFGEKASLSLTGFKQTARDLIAFMQVATDPLPTSQYQNIGQVSNKGLEVEAGFMPVPWLALKGQYGYVRSRIDAVGAAGGQVAVGDQPVGVPSHTAGAALTVTPSEGTTLNVGVTYVGSFRGTDWLVMLRCLANLSGPECPESFLTTRSLRGFVVRYPGFAKFNASVTHHFSQYLGAFLAVDNLTNNNAFEFANSSPVVGRMTMLGFDFTY